MSGFFPTGGAPTGSAALGVEEALASSMAATGVTGANNIRVSITEAMAMGESILDIDLPNLIDALNLTGSVLGYSTLRNSVAETVSFGDTLQAAWALLLQENLVLAGAAVGNPFLLGAIVDTLHATGAATSRVDAVAAVAAAMAMESLCANGWSVSALDAVAFNDALTAAARLLGPLVDSAAMADGVENGVRLIALASDTLAGTDSLAGVLSMSAELEDSLLLYATIRLGGTEYTGWVLNTDSQAPSQYTNMPFESLATGVSGRFKNRTFGAGSGGIFELVGDNDAGTAIPAYIRTGLIDFGTSRKKRVPEVYIGLSGDGRVVLKVVTTRTTGEKEEDWYIQAESTRTGSDVRTARVKVARGLCSNVWGFELHNKAGGTLDLSKIEVRRLILDRRL